MSLLCEGEQKNRQSRTNRRMFIGRIGRQVSRLALAAILTGCAKGSTSNFPIPAIARIELDQNAKSGICEVSTFPNALVDLPDGFLVTASDDRGSLRFSLDISPTPTPEHLIEIDGHLSGPQVSSYFGIKVPLVRTKQYQGAQYKSYFQMSEHQLRIAWNETGVLTNYRLDEETFEITDQMRTFGQEAFEQRSGINLFSIFQQ